MSRPPIYFWFLVFASVALVGSGMWSEQNTPTTNEELQFRIRALQGQIRLAEGHQMMALESGLTQPDWNERAELITTTEAIALGGSDGHASSSVRTQAAALWLILKLTDVPNAERGAATSEENAPRMSSGALAKRAKLSTTDTDTLALMLETATGPLAAGLNQLANGTPIPPGALTATNTTPWLQHRLELQSKHPNGPLRPESRWLEAERSFLQRTVVLQTVVALISILGILLLILAPILGPKRMLRTELSPPWRTDWWVGWYISLAWFLSYQGVSLVVLELMAALDLLQEPATGLQVIAQVISLLLALHLMRHYTHTRTTWAGLILTLKLGVASMDGQVQRALAYALALVAIASPLVMVATQIVEWTPIRTREHVAILEALQATSESASPIAELSLLLTVTVGAPFCEETIFRAFMYRQLRSRYGIAWGTALSALAFACVHGSVASLLPLFVLGVLLAFVVEWSGSVLPAIIAHGLWNLYQLMIPLVILAP